MKKLQANRVCVSDDGDYFQVLFEEEWDSLKNYFLIQRNFEHDYDEEPDRCYIETDNEGFCGHLDIEKAELDRNRFYLKLADKKDGEIEITFQIRNENYLEAKRVLKIIFSGLDTLTIRP